MAEKGVFLLSYKVNDNIIGPGLPKNIVRAEVIVILQNVNILLYLLKHRSITHNAIRLRRYNSYSFLPCGFLCPMKFDSQTKIYLFPRDNFGQFTVVVMVQLIHYNV